MNLITQHNTLRGRARPHDVIHRDSAVRAPQ